MEAWMWIFPGGYVLLSLIFFIFPTLLHKKKRTHINAFQIGHRGGSGEGIENTLGAFKNSVACGMQMLELDVRMTKDHEVVVIHDMELSRTCGVHKYVAETDYEDLPPYLPIVPLVFVKDRAVFRADSSTDRRIPLLSEVFDHFPDTPINVDIKQDDMELIVKVSQMIEERGREKITVWGSFEECTTKKLFEENPEIPLMTSLSGVGFITLTFYLGLLPFMPIKEQFFEIPLLYAGSINAMIPPRVFGKLIVKTVNFFLSNRLLFWHLQARGIKVFLWVLNEEYEFDGAVRLGADGIMTDYPSKLANYVRKNGIVLPTNDSNTPLNTTIPVSPVSTTSVNSSIYQDTTLPHTTSKINSSTNSNTTTRPESTDDTHINTTTPPNTTNGENQKDMISRKVKEYEDCGNKPSLNTEVSNSLRAIDDQILKREVISEDVSLDVRKCDSGNENIMCGNNASDYINDINSRDYNSNLRKRQSAKLTRR